MRRYSEPNLRLNPDEVHPFGSYFLLKKLAEGGMAEIFLAKHVGPEGFERNVVIKRMLPNLCSDPEFVEMFLHEAKLAARLTHPNIIQIHDLNLADGYYYICMEYLAGEDFSTVLRRANLLGPHLPIGLAARVIVDAAHGLNSAHESTDEQGNPLNIVHRDISPSNIYVTYEGQVKLLDFGIAKAESRLTRTTTGVVKGKYTYMSPEQARGEQVDRRADVFSLGVSLYESLTFVRPFFRQSDLGILNAVIRGDFKPPREHRSDISPEVEAIILKAMAGKVEERYQTALALASDLEPFAVSNKEVSGYLKDLFGPDVVAQKTRIPAFTSLVSSSQASAESSKSFAARAASVHRGGDTNQTHTVSLPPSSRGKARGWYVGAAFALVSALAAGSGMWVLHVNSAPKPAAQAAPSVAAPVPAPTGVTPIAPPQMPPPLPKAPVVVAKRVELDEAAVQRIVEKHRASISHCFEAFQSELPSEDGAVTVTFTILNSGKVVRPEVGEPLASTRVGGCLKERVRRLPFPPNTAKETRLGVPFAYHIER